MRKPPVPEAGKGKARPRLGFQSRTGLQQARGATLIHGKTPCPLRSTSIPLRVTCARVAEYWASRLFPAPSVGHLPACVRSGSQLPGLSVRAPQTLLPLQRFRSCGPSIRTFSLDWQGCPSFLRKLVFCPLFFCAGWQMDKKHGRMRNRRAQNRASEFREQALCTAEARMGRPSAAKTAHSTAFSVISGLP